MIRRQGSGEERWIQMGGGRERDIKERTKGCRRNRIDEKERWE
jgi:hypothetical protein